MNTNKAYDSLMQRRKDRTGENGIPGYQRELMRHMDDINLLVGRTPKEDPRYKELIRKGRAIFDEMQRAGIEVKYG